MTLAAGARDMGRRGVLVRRLEAIENLGSMDILCTDKTGTLTEGTRNDIRVGIARSRYRSLDRCMNFRRPPRGLKPIQRRYQAG